MCNRRIQENLTYKVQSFLGILQRWENLVYHGNSWKLWPSIPAGSGTRRMALTTRSKNKYIGWWGLISKEFFFMYKDVKDEMVWTPPMPKC